MDSLYFDTKIETDEKIIYFSKFKVAKKYVYRYFDKEFEELLSKFKEIQKEIFLLRVYGYTLLEIGKKFDLTRERVRQIESKISKYLLSNFPKELDVFITKQVNKHRIFLSKNLSLHNDDFIAIVEYLYLKKTPIFFDKKLKSFTKESFLSLKEQLFKLDYLISKEQLFSEFNEEMIKVFIENKLLKKIDNNYLVNKFSLNRDKIEFIISLFPNGIATRKNFHLIQDKLKIYFEDEFKNKSQRNILTPIDHSDKIILWDWGEYIHIDNVPNINLDEIIECIYSYLEDIPIDINICFEKFKDFFLENKIKSKYGLHSLLKLKYPDEFSYQDSPYIALKGENRVSLLDILEKVIIEDRIYHLTELLEKTKIPKLRLTQAIDRDKNIIQVDEYQYKHIKFIKIDFELFYEIETFILEKVKTLTFIYVDLVIEQFRDKLNNYKFDLKVFLSDYFKKYSDKFQVSNKKFIINSLILTRDNLNFHYLIKNNLFKDKNIVSLNEVNEYFVNRGLNSSKIIQYLIHSAHKYVVRIDENSLMRLEDLGLNEEIIKDINTNLQDLKEFRLDEVFDRLPTIKYSWNRFILGDILDDKWSILPNRLNPLFAEKK